MVLSLSSFIRASEGVKGKIKVLSPLSQKFLSTCMKYYTGLRGLVHDVNRKNKKQKASMWVLLKFWLAEQCTAGTFFCQSRLQKMPLSFKGPLYLKWNVNFVLFRGIILSVQCCETVQISNSTICRQLIKGLSGLSTHIFCSIIAITTTIGQQSSSQCGGSIQTSCRVGTPIFFV